MAEVANTWPLLPTDRTTMDATTTIKSEKKKKKEMRQVPCDQYEETVIATEPNVQSLTLAHSYVKYLLMHWNKYFFNID